MKRIAYPALAAALLLSACNLPGGSGAADPQPATAAALTVEAALNHGSTPLASPAAGSQAAPNAESTEPYTQPLIGVDDVVNCRTGPGVNYERVTQILPGDTVEIVGFYPPNYWIVSTDEGPCWVSGEFVTPSGSTSVVPTVTAPSTPEGNPPQNVSLQKWDIFCNYVTNEANVNIVWADKEGEDGYRIHRNGTAIAELPANSTQFSETIILLSGQSVGYNVIAFNALGATTSRTATMTCP
jgi:hypothetical protein